MTYHKTELYKSMYLTLYVRKVKFKKKILLQLFITPFNPEIILYHKY